MRTRPAYVRARANRCCEPSARLPAHRIVSISSSRLGAHQIHFIEWLRLNTRRNSLQVPILWRVSAKMLGHFVICYLLLPFLGLPKPVCGFAVPPFADVWSRQRSVLVRPATGEKDAVYVYSEDDNVVDDAYLPSVAPSKVKASGVDSQTDLDIDSPPKAHPRRNTLDYSGGRGGGRGRGRGDGRGRGRGRQGRGRGRGRGGGRGRGRGNNSDSPALRAAKEINSEIVGAETHQEVLNAFASRGGAKGLAGGGVFNSVNFSTCLHRLARVASAFNPDGAAAQAETRRGILADPRFALLFCSAAEAIVGVDESISATASMNILEGADVEDRVAQLIKKDGGAMRVQFKPREVSNVAWAISKLRFSPPASVLPLIRSSEYPSGDDDGVQVMTKEDIILDLVTTSLKVRSQVLEVAKERSAIADPALKAKVKSRWIPTLSQLGAKVLDLIAAFGPDLYDPPSSSSSQSGSSSSQECSNTLYSFATAGRADSPFFDVLAKRHFEVTAEMMKKNGQRARPQEYSNSIYAFATAGITSNRQREFVCYVASHFEDPDFVSQFKPQELSNTAYSCAKLISKRSNGDNTVMEANDGSTVSFAEEEDAVLRILRIVASALEERVEEFKPQEISNCLWSYATLGFGSVETQSHPSNGYIFLKSDRHEEDKAQVAHILDIVSKSASQRMNRFRTQELNNLAWSYARLGHRGEASNEIYSGVGNEILRRSHQFDPQDIGTCLWAMASMEFFDDEVYMVAASRLNRRSAKLYKPQEMSNVCWAMGHALMKPKYLGAFDTTLVPAGKRPSLDDISDDPITECFFTATAEMMRRPQQFKEQEIKDIMWSMSRIGMRHPRLFKMFAEYLVGNADSTEDRGHGLRGFSSQGIANLAWSYAKQAQLASSAEYSRLKVGSQGRQAVHETSCLDVGELQINRLFSRVAEEALHGPGGLDRFSAQDLANKCWSFAILGLLHTEYFEGVGNIVSKRLTLARNTKAASRKPSALSFKGQEVANLLWSYGTLNFPCDEMVDALSSHVVSLCRRRGDGYDGTAIAKLFISQELANSAWSMAVLKRYPEGLVDIAYQGLFGCGGSDDEVNRLRQNGVQSEHLMSSLYTQMALDMEAPHLGKLLPSDFPQGWIESSNSGKSRGTAPKERRSDDSGSTSMLNLNSSRLQQSIGKTLHRIGFDHVQEHTIGADDIFSARNRQIDTSAFPAEFLSIDIANIEEKIGIEVDGPAHFVTVLDDESDESGHVKSHSGRNNGGGKVISSAGNDGKIMWEFLSNGRRRVNGPTAFKHRLLGHLGWRIIHIPFWEWRELKGDEAAEEKYLRDILNEV